MRSRRAAYQSENAPCYHARDVAKYRCAQAGRAAAAGLRHPHGGDGLARGTGRLSVCCELRQRYQPAGAAQGHRGGPAPGAAAGHAAPSSASRCMTELQENMAAGEQSILFLNRRGSSRHAAVRRVRLCAGVPPLQRAPDVSLAPTTGSCATTAAIPSAAPERCPDCGGAMKHIGFGTQRVEEELHELFPGIGGAAHGRRHRAAGHHEALLRQVRGGARCPFCWAPRWWPRDWTLRM